MFCDNIFNGLILVTCRAHMVFIMKIKNEHSRVKTLGGVMVLNFCKLSDHTTEMTQFFENMS